ncbi:cytochrome c oxidase subunit I [Mariniblastus fucicola]|uniref:Alternative cytochrome c oxidase subunit 1 n=1 Tax=Mariniblastus fucicola TaxID=980251 RepID=A0A5B9PHN0_9BACT|nr:cbb3-type cytochrome c oxidase subunit I [Mariniblastus fucicola]QEG24156.1 Alternative cytochrome c oxidase subunit 1 [Mariniblastus fucicola]
MADPLANQLPGAESQRRSVPVRFFTTCVFATDHKVIGRRFLFSSLIWFAIGGLFALAIRWQLAWPWSDVPILGSAINGETGVRMSPRFYDLLFSMHATIMVFFVMIPILFGAFGNFLIPLMTGADDMAFPRLNMLGYWLMWPAFGCLTLCFLLYANGLSAEWTVPPSSLLSDVSQSIKFAQQLWILSLLFVVASSMLGAINILTTVLQMRSPGMNMIRLPMTVWGLFISATLQAIAYPVLIAALMMQLSDLTFGTGFTGLNLAGDDLFAVDGSAQAIPWRRLFWSVSRPAAYILILPVIGMVSDMIACFSRKPLFGYRPMVCSIIAIAGLGLAVCAHQQFAVETNGSLMVSLVVPTTLIVIAISIKAFNWFATMRNGQLQLSNPMLFSIGVVLMIMVGGFVGVIMSVPKIGMNRGTNFAVADLHYLLFGSSILGVFAAIYFWFPKMFGRKLNLTLGKLHFLFTFLLLNCTFLPMYLLKQAHLPGTLPPHQASALAAEPFKNMSDFNVFITWSAILLGATQLIFVANFLGSLFFGKKAEANPWRCNSLEWTTPSPPVRGNFETQPLVYRGPYEYGHPDRDQDFWPQSEPETSS